MITLSADVGGTFTDLVLAVQGADRTWADKVLSTPSSPEAVLAGIERLTARAAIQPSDIDVFVHGFTIATNAWLTRSGSKVVLVVTDGFRDVLEIGSQRRMQLYSLVQQRAAPLVPRSRVIEVIERMDAAGVVVQPLSSEAARAAADAVAALEPEAVAVALVFGHLNDQHERLLGDALRQRLPGIPVYLSSHINPQIEEFPRTLTTVSAAYVGPVVDAYVARLESALPRIGVRAPVLLMRSDGGISTIEAVRNNPATVLLSGPAGGVTASLEAGARLGIRDMVTFDMGGTSADFSLITGGRTSATSSRAIMGDVLRVPSLDIHTISAGGGSLSWVDLGGALRVGPQSAGSSPGPACYGLGGDLPTLTDAALALGYLGAQEYLGGEMTLDIDAARSAIERHVAKPLGITGEDAAFGMIAIANVQMAQAIRQVTVERGHDVRQFALMSFGGAGGVFAPFLARDLEMREIVVPARPGVFSALGLLQSDFRYSLQKPLQVPLASVDVDTLIAALHGLRAVALENLKRDRVAPADQILRPMLDLRYVGQMHELTVNAPGPLLDGWWDSGSVHEAFCARHELEYGFADRAMQAEIVNLRLEAIGRVRKPDLRAGELPDLDREGFSGLRPIHLGPTIGWVEARVLQRSALSVQDAFDGPCILHQPDTTILVLPGQRVVVGQDGVLIIREIGVHQ